MSIYDVLMTALLLSIVVLMVVNHRTGWLANRMLQTSHHADRHSDPEARRTRRDAEERATELVQIHPTSPSGD